MTKDVEFWGDSLDVQYRVIYVARLADAIHVLHAFEKKTQRTSKRDLDLARERLQRVQEKQRQRR